MVERGRVLLSGGEKVLARVDRKIGATRLVTLLEKCTAFRDHARLLVPGDFWEAIYDEKDSDPTAPST